MSNEEMSRLDTNLVCLLDSVNVDNLVYNLYAKNCIHRWQKEHLQNNLTMMKQVTELVDILVRRSYANFKEFINILDETGHCHVARVLREGGGLLSLPVVS